MNVNWQKSLNEYVESGQTRAEFCRQKDLRLTQFNYYLKKLHPDLVVKACAPNKSSDFSKVVTIKKSLPEPAWVASVLAEMIKRL
jgi:hypothetical protein